MQIWMILNDVSGMFYLEKVPFSVESLLSQRQNGAFLNTLINKTSIFIKEFA
jgi:hypothetical protein